MRVLLILAVAWLLGTRCSAPPELPPDFTWIRWSNAVAGYALEVPDAYAADVEEGGNAVYFRWGRTVPAKVYVTDLETARGWGLWPGHEPIADTVLAGLPAKMYGYVHCDGPFCSRIESFVAQRDGCWLAIEFRSEGDLDPVQQRILLSLAHPRSGARPSAGCVG